MSTNRSLAYTVRRNSKLMEVLHCFFLVLLCAFFSPATVIRAQDDQSGFISIDCGAPGDTNYTDAKTGIRYISDAGLVDTGLSNTISSVQPNTLFQRQLQNLRSFPEGIRNCYILRPAQGNFNKYLIRATFLYGDYDGKNQLPQFDLHLGADYWDTVKFTNISLDVEKEIIHVPSSDIIYVCLVNTGLGTPFISELELRPLNNTMYTTMSGSLNLFARFDFGNNGSQIIRYKDDIYDRIWLPAILDDQTAINTALTVNVSPTNFFKPPSIVMSTASAPLNSSKPLTFWWPTNNITDEYYIYMYFAEIQELQPNQSREFSIYLNGKLYYDQPITPKYLRGQTLFSNVPDTNYSRYEFSFIKTENSTLPPIINALEVYKVINIQHSQTDDKDTAAMLSIKLTYSITRNWQGDPCAPQAYIWHGLNCSYNGFSSPRIISLNLSSSGLTGALPPVISNLTMLQTLDLSNNKLIGQVPDFLAELASLKILNLKGNNFTGPIPSKLLQKSQDGLLSLSMDGLGNGTANCKSDPCKKKNKVIIPVVASIGALFLLLTSLAILWIIRRKKQGSQKKSNRNDFTLETKKRQFSYSKILDITNNLQRVLGRGSFGIVYHGCVENTEVAVKMFSSSLDEGFKELQSEANVLMNVHHRNLISLVGYCIDEPHVGIIYEYMANGDLKGHLSDENLYVLSWQERLQIAIDAAQGLEYMHHGCKPPIVHRDVKTTNILLNDKFEAKIADFGLCKTFPDGTVSHISTDHVAGTRGYLDPEYYNSYKLTEKSDVYSFGVVLMEIITSQPAIIASEYEIIHLSQWVSSTMEQGDVKDIVDPRLMGEFNVNSVRKAIEVAIACVSRDSSRRPTMNQVVMELKEFLAMEMTRQEMKSSQSGIMRTSLLASN